MSTDANSKKTPREPKIHGAFLCLKIHVGRNQKFTSKNSWSKNSHGPIWVGLCGPVWVGLFFGGVPYLENLCKVTENKRPPQPQKIFFLLFSRHIMI